MSRKNADHAALRQGFTTGTAATAAAKAGLLAALGVPVASHVDVPLPGGGRLAVPVESVCAEGQAWRASVIKDGGDDPDATHGARVSCLVRLDPAGATGDVSVEGGSGVGRVTRPGLPVPVGRAAINPAPMAQIKAGAREALRQGGFAGAASVVVEIENGEALAKRTLNPRLGVVGGLSILGTAGVVKPFSHAAWRATIDSGLRVARAAGLDVAGFSTGRRSERLLAQACPDLPELALVQAADFFAFSLRLAVRLGFSRLVWGCYFGKLVKMAQGLEYTHAHAGPTDTALLADLAALAGAQPDLIRQVAHANTARHALELVEAPDLRRRFVTLAAARALQSARMFAGNAPRIRVMCFDFEDKPLVTVESGGDGEGAEERRR